MHLDQLRDRVADGTIDTVIVGFTDHYGRTMGKRFDAPFFLESCASDGTHGCDYLLTVDMEMEPVEGYAFANAKSEPNDHPGMPFSSAKLDGSFNPPETSWSYAPANVKDGTKELIDRTPRDFQGSKGHI